MINKRILWILVIAILIVPNVDATITTGLLQYFNFEDNDATDKSGQGNSGTLQGSPNFHTGSHGQYINFSPSGSYINNNFGDSLLHNDSMTISFLIDCSDVVVGNYEQMLHTENNRVIFIANNNLIPPPSFGDFTFRFRDSSNNIRDWSINNYLTNIQDGNWHLVTAIKYPGTSFGFDFYFDGSNQSSSLYVQNSDSLSAEPIGFNFSIEGSSGSRSQCYYDNFAIWNRALTDAEVLQLNSSGGEINTLMIMRFFNVDPQNNTNVNVDTDINFTLSSVNSSATCQIFHEGSNIVNKTGLGNGTFNFSFNSSYWVEGANQLNVTCSDAITTNSQIKSIFVDTVSPEITAWTFPTNLNTSVVNKSVPFILNISVNDTNLWSFNITIINETGFILYEDHVQNITNTSYTYENETTLNLDQDHVLNVTVTVADYHTAHRIPNFTIANISSGKIIGGVSYLSNTSGLNRFNVRKLHDRYVFNLTYSTPKNRIVQDLVSSEKIHYVEHSPYMANFVHGNRWTDYENPHLVVSKIQRISDYHYRIHMQTRDLIPRRSFEFSSTGLINTFSQSVTMNYSAGTPLLTSACGGENLSVLRFNIFDEDIPTNPLNATFEIEAQFGESIENQLNYSANFSSNHSHVICLTPPSKTVYCDAYIKYTTSNGFTHRYYLVNQSLNTNITLNASIYNFNHTTGLSDLKITVRDSQTYQYFRNVVTKLQRKYLSEGAWRTVQMDESGDFGLLFYNVYEENTDYRLIFSDRQNNILKTTSSMKFVCESGICDATVLLDPSSAVAPSNNVSSQIVYNNATGIINASWNDPTGLSTSIEFSVIKETSTGSTTICEESQAVSTGSAECDISLHTGVFYASIKSTSNGIEMGERSEWILAKPSMIGSHIGQRESAFWGAGFGATSAALGAMISPVAAVISLVVSIVALFAMGILDFINVSFIIIMATLGIAIGIKVRS